MKIAYLILAHKNIKQVERLINKIKNDNCSIFLHCDKRWDEGFNYFSQNENCVCSNNRYESNLDEWSLVEAELELIKLARRYGEFQYYVLLSGQDYPIVKLELIMSELDRLYPKPLIDCTPLAKNNWVNKKFNSNIYFFKCSREINKHISNSLFRKALKILPYISNKIVDCFTTPKKRLGKLGIKLYGGSAWWILPDMLIDFIIKENSINSKYICELRKTITPEETFFQVLSMNSPCREMIDVNPVDMVLQNCKTFAYFSGINKPFRGHPYIFTSEKDDLHLIKEKSHNFLFARKFDMDVDAHILDIIDDEFI